MTYLVVSIATSLMGVGFGTLIFAILCGGATRNVRKMHTFSMIGATGGVQVIVGAVVWGIVILKEVAAYYANH